MRLTIAIFAFLFPLIASADEWHTLVRYNCDKKQDRLIVAYVGAYNEEGEILDRSAGEDDWPKPAENIEGPFIRSCHLSDGIYSYEVRGVPEGQVNPMGRCGAWSSAKVRITKEDKIMVEEQLDDNCWNPEAPIVSKIVVVAGNSTPIISRVKPDDFYDPKSDFEDADQELNRIYQQSMSSLTKAKKEELRKEQRAWLKIRDPKCHKEADDKNAGIGTMWPTFYSSCRASYTRERVQELKKQLTP